MDGGAIIGYGTFGCVFDPPLRVLSKEDGTCKKINTNLQTVGKISESDDVKNEIEASKILSQIPKSSLYFVLLDMKSIHRPCPETQQDDIGLKSCPIIKRAKMSNMLHFTMPYSGIGMSKYFSIHIRDTTPLPVEKVLTHLLESASLLALHNYVHYDIHSENILFDNVTKMPRIIDFGFSFQVKNINTETISTRWKVYSPEYASEAPELTAIQGIRHKMSFNMIIRQIISEKAPIKNSHFLLGLPMVKQEQSFQYFWKKSKSIQEENWVLFFKYYWPGFDAWSIGVVILKLYTHIAHISKYTKMPFWNKLSGKIKAILRGLLRMNPIERIDCVEALYIFHPESPILNTDVARSWLQEKENIRRPTSI